MPTMTVKNKKPQLAARGNYFSTANRRTKIPAIYEGFHILTNQMHKYHKTGQTHFISGSNSYMSRHQAAVRGNFIKKQGKRKRLFDRSRNRNENNIKINHK